ncbi:DUF4278 domain-containing protein [Prochlorococcus marinus]|uniref:DUF4278 domain-containing protein n=1 Tax=Prochlorococcus marinus TaxID=1219 RepID=UPI0022B57E7C|nr:DUF4278 domain-containing protein [Prochlorococcus marinus]
MTTLLYRGLDYVQHKKPVAKNCTELTYRREHYNTCRDTAKSEVHSTLAYRGSKYSK